MVGNIYKKVCVAAARLAAALVLFGGSLVAGEALLAAQGGGNVAHAQSNLNMTWSESSGDTVGGVLTWSGGLGSNYGIRVGTARNGSDVYVIHGGTNPTGTGNPGTYTFTGGQATFARGTQYFFQVYTQGGGNTSNSQSTPFTPPAAIGGAVSVSVTFGNQVGKVDANLTWGKNAHDLDSWEVKANEGASCTSGTETASFTGVAAAARSQSFGALFTRGSPYSFCIRGKSVSGVSVTVYSAWVNTTITPAALAAPETPVLSRIDRIDNGLRLYLVKSSINLAYALAFDDGTGLVSSFFYPPANVTAGGVFNVGNIQIDRYALHDVSVTVWGAHADGVTSTLSGASIIVTAYNSYARPPTPPPPPTPPGSVLNAAAAAGSPDYAGVTISWDPPASIDGVKIARYEVSYGGTVTVSARQSGSHGVSLFSNLFGLASDYSKTIPVTLRAVSDAGAYGPAVVVTPSNSTGNIDSWKGAEPDTDNIPRIVRVEPFLKNPPSDDQILFRVFVDVDRAYKMENFRFNGFQSAGLQNTENTEVEGGFGSYQLLDAFNQIIMVTVDTVDEGEINASAFPSGTYSIRIRSFNGLWGTHGTPPPEQFSEWYPFSYNVAHFTTGDLSALNAVSGDGQLVVNGTYNRPANVDNRVLPYQYIHPVGGNTVDVQGAGGFRAAIDGLINGVAYTVSARLGENSWQTVVGTPYSADAPQIVAFLGDDARSDRCQIISGILNCWVGTVTNIHYSNVATLRWEINYDGAQNPRVELMHRGVAQTVEHDAGSRHYSYLVTVAKNEEYVYTLRAHSNGGSSGFATATVFLPQSAPGAAATAYASPARNGFTVFWTTPADTGGADISHYSVVALDLIRAVINATSTTYITTNIGVSDRVNEASGVKSYVVSGAPLGVRQCLAIRAYNGAFPTVAGPAATACAAPGAVPAMPILNALIGNTLTISLDLSAFSSEDGNTVSIGWNKTPTVQDEAALFGGVPAASVEYLLSYADSDNMARNMTILGKGGVTLVRADGIKHGTRYVFTLRARNIFGTSPANVFSFTTRQQPPLSPSAPRSFSIERISGSTVSVVAKWGLPSSLGGNPDDATADDMVYRVFYYPLSGGMLHTTTLTINSVETTFVTTMHFLATITAATEATLSISKATVDWRFYLLANNARAADKINIVTLVGGGSTLYPFAVADYDHYADDFEASRALEMRNVAVGVSDLSQDPAVIRQGFTITWDEPQNDDGTGWPVGGDPTTLSRYVRLIILAEAVSPNSLIYAYHDVIQSRGTGGGWGVDYANGSGLVTFQTCAPGCRNATGTGANLNLAFDFSRKYRFTLAPYVKDAVGGTGDYWGKATVVQVAPYIHPTAPNAGMPYNVRTDGASITWLPLGIGTGHANISLSHYELTEITGGTITAVALSPGNPRKQLVFIPFEEANAVKHTVSLMSPQSNKGVFRHSQLTTPIPLRTYRYEETQTVGTVEMVVTSTLYDRSRYYRVQTFFKSHIKGHVFAAQNGVATVTFVPPLPPGEAAPDAPANLAAMPNVADRKLMVSWTRPDDKGRRILDYALLYNGFAAQVSGHLQAYTLAMRPGKLHTVQLVARNVAGAGAVAMVVATSSVGAPGMPVIAAVKPRNASILVSWEAPANDGGMPITGYIATVFGGAAATVEGGGNARSHTFTGLTNGIVYTVGVYAGNGEATGLLALATVAPHPTRPGAPSNFALTANGHASLGVSWAAPSDTGGAAISRYLVYLDGFVAATVGSSGTNAQLTGLAFGPSGIDYNVAVAAQNARGVGARVAGVATVMGKPGAPKNIAAAYKSGVEVSWQPADTAGATIIHYSILQSGDATGSVSVAANATTHNYGDLSPGSYVFEMFAYNALGKGDSTFLSLSPPSAPQIGAVKEAHERVILPFSAPASDGNLAITHYEVAYNVVGAAATMTVTVVADARVVTVTGLTNGSDYSFVMRAINPLGVATAAAATATPAVSPPFAPEAFNATFVATVTGAIALSWGNTDSNGSPITAFIVYVDNTPTVTLTNTGGTLYQNGGAYTISGLARGANYTVEIAAQNAATANSGVGDRAQAVASPLGVPGAPGGFAAVANFPTVVVSWTQGETYNGAITSYVLINSGTMTLGGGVLMQEYIVPTIGAQIYSLYAVNVGGNGDTVAITVTVEAIAPKAPNLAPPQPSPTLSTGISVSWTTAPADDGGAPITAYIISVNGNAVYTMTITAGSTATAFYYLLTTNGQGGPLVIGEVYSIDVVAQNSVGYGVRASENGSLLSAPGMPPNFVARAGNGQITLSWGEASANGTVVTDYVLTRTMPAGGSPESLGAGARGKTVSGLNNGTVYVYELYAVNGKGNGKTATATATPVHTPQAPANLMVSEKVGNDGKATVTWTPPFNNGSAITGYTVIYIVAGTEATGSWMTATAAADATMLVVDGLTEDAIYMFSVQAVNALGGGEWAGVSNLSNPGMPPNFTATPGDRQLVLSWGDAPRNGADVTAYVLTRAGSGGFTMNLGDVKTYTDEGLVNGDSYSYELYALNSVAGNGATAAVSERPGRGPGTPGNFRASSGDENGYVTVSWTAPTDTGGRDITGYSFRYIKASLAAETPSDSWQPDSANANATSKVFYLEASVAYRFSLRAVNSLGESDWVGAQSGGNQAAELDKAILPVAAAALSRQWSQAINQRLSQVGAFGGGGLQANALGANFGKGQMERGVAELLRKHGGALANGQKLDGDALRNFTFSLGGGSGNGMGATGGGMGAGYSKLLNGGGIWGGASYTNMEDKKGETPWKGDNIAYYAGIDRAMDAERRLLAGVMFAHNRLETDYTRSSDNSRGEYNLRATGAHPYLLWRSPDNASRLWATFGYGAGKVEFAQANQAKTTRDAKIYSAAGGFRRNLWSNAKGAEVDGQADFAVANIEVENPGEANSKANSKNFRALLEARKRVQMANGGEASPFARAGFRHQSGDSSKSGWELAVGWRWNAKGGWNGEISGGAAGLSGGYKEWNANAMLRKNDIGGKGLWLTLRPQYGVNGGNPVAASDDLWRAMQVKDNNAKDRAASLSLDVGYGLFGASALWRPFVGATVGENAGEYRAGAKWESRLRADMGMSAGVSAKRKPKVDEMQVNFSVTY